ncbi:vomeronasal type-2 receptor 26 [Pogona vitticeps]
MQSALEKYLAQAGGCLAMSRTIRDPYSEINTVAREIGRSTATVFLCHCYHFHFQLLAKALQAQNIHKMWIMTASFAVDPEIFTSEMLHLLNGSLDLRVHSDKIPGFKNFLTTFRPAAYPSSHLVKILWQNLFKCTWPSVGSTRDGVNRSRPCTGVEELDAGHFDLNNPAATFQAYLATRAYITAYRDMMSCTFNKRSCVRAKPFQPWQVYHYVKNINFTISSQEIFFKDGEVPAVFDITNLQISPNGSLKAVKVGQFHSGSPLGKELVVQDSAIVWTGNPAQVPHSVCTESCLPGQRKLPLQGKPSCCYDCQRCPDGQFASGTDSANCWNCPPGQWPNHIQDRCFPVTIDFLSYTETLGAVLATSSCLLFLLSLSILCIFIRYRHTPIVKANNRALSYLLLTSLALCFLCPFMFLGCPSQLTCSLRETVFGLVFAVCLSATLAKTVTVVLAFRASKPDSYFQRWVGYKLSVAITLCCPLTQAAVCVVWITERAPFPSQNPLHGGPHVMLECDKGSLQYFYIMLGYLALLAIISLGVAFPAHRLPTAFNEAQHIAISMLIFTFVWIAFVPSYLSATGKYMVAVEIFAILASAGGLLGCLFFPKCYIILLRPDRNNRCFLLGRQFPHN